MEPNKQNNISECSDNMLNSYSMDEIASVDSISDTDCSDALSLDENSKKNNVNGYANTNNDRLQEVHIVVNRHKQFFEMLHSPRQIFRVVSLFFVVVLVLFGGLAIVALSIKRVAPYNIIKSNEYGALLMSYEDKDIINFMFNTAEFMANSGIEVKEGEDIEIKATGTFNTTIHYLVEKNLDAQWIDADGMEPTNIRDSLLRADGLHIAPSATAECLLCVILTNDDIISLESIKDKTWKNISSMKKRHQNLSEQQDSVIENITSLINHLNQRRSIISVGKNRKFKAPQSGTLFFVINDLIYTKKVKNILYNKENYQKVWSGVDEYKSDIERFELCPFAWYLDNVGSFLVTIEKNR